MAYKTLNINMDMGVSAKTSLTKSSVQFGNGYTQHYSFGINNKRTNWNGSKTGDYQTVIQPIESFLEEHKGIYPFYWVDPKGVKSLYICESWNTNQRKANLWQITLDFKHFLSV